MSAPIHGVSRMMPVATPNSEEILRIDTPRIDMLRIDEPPKAANATKPGFLPGFVPRSVWQAGDWQPFLDQAPNTPVLIMRKG